MSCSTLLQLLFNHQSTAVLAKEIDLRLPAICQLGSQTTSGKVPSAVFLNQKAFTTTRARAAREIAKTFRLKTLHVHSRPTAVDFHLASQLNHRKFKPTICLDLLNAETSDRTATTATCSAPGPDGGIESCTVTYLSIYVLLILSGLHIAANPFKDPKSKQGRKYYVERSPRCQTKIPTRNICLWVHFHVQFAMPDANSYIPISPFFVRPTVNYRSDGARHSRPRWSTGSLGTTSR